jgi:DNA repair protein RadC
VKGLGEAKAIEIKAALELGARLKLGDGSERPAVNSPDDAARLVVDEMSMFEQEHVRLLILDARNRVLDAPDVYVGSVHTAQVRVGELLKPAVRANASSIVLVHNHPSGDPSPSSADVALTRNVREAAKLLDIDFHDHVVIGGGRHVSMREHGMGFDDGS